MQQTDRGKDTYSPLPLPRKSTVATVVRSLATGREITVWADSPGKRTQVPKGAYTQQEYLRLVRDHCRALARAATTTRTSHHRILAGRTPGPLLLNSPECPFRVPSRRSACKNSSVIKIKKKSEKTMPMTNPSQRVGGAGGTARADRPRAAINSVGCSSVTVVLPWAAKAAQARRVLGEHVLSVSTLRPIRTNQPTLQPPCRRNQFTDRSRPVSSPTPSGEAYAPATTHLHSTL